VYTCLRWGVPNAQPDVTIRSPVKLIDYDRFQPIILTRDERGGEGFCIAKSRESRAYRLGSVLAP
jgi:hypothetical protein